jgi:hypothetical protein
VGRILRRLKQLRLSSFNRGDHAVESERSVENTDALAATGGMGLDPQSGMGHPSFPPGYVRPDDGRPQH